MTVLFSLHNRCICLVCTSFCFLQLHKHNSTLSSHYWFHHFFCKLLFAIEFDVFICVLYTISLALPSWADFYSIYSIDLSENLQHLFLRLSLIYATGYIFFCDCIGNHIFLPIQLTAKLLIDFKFNSESIFYLWSKLLYPCYPSVCVWLPPLLCLMY